MDRRTFGKILREKRLGDLDLNLDKMALKTGLSTSYIDNIEKGHTKKPKAITQKKISEGYGIDIDVVRSVFRINPREEDESRMMDAILKQILADEKLQLKKELRKIIDEDLSRNTKLLIIRLYEALYKKKLL